MVEYIVLVEYIVVEYIGGDGRVYSGRGYSGGRVYSGGDGRVYSGGPDLGKVLLLGIIRAAV